MSNTSEQSDARPRRGFFVRLIKPSPRGNAGRSRSYGVPPVSDMPGYIGGVHHAAYVSAIRTLKTSGQRGDLEQLLLRLIDATEDEARHSNFAVSAGYYHELSRLYRKSGDIVKEQAVLKRFASQTHAPGSKSARLVKRLSTKHSPPPAP